MHKGPFDIKKPILRQQVMWWRQANQPTNGSDIQCLKSKRTNLLPCHREDHWLNRIVPSFKHVIGSHGPSVDLESKAAQHQGLKDLDLRFNWYFPFPKKGFLQRPPCLLCFCHPVLDVLPRTAIRLNLSAHMFVATNQLQLVRYCKVTQSNFRRRWNKVLLLQQSTSFATKCDHQLSFLRLEVHQQASACRCLAPALGYSLSCGNQLMAMGVSNHNADIVNKANIIKCSTGRKNEAIFPLITSFRNAIGKPLHVWGLHLWTIFFQHWTHEQIEANVSNWVTRSGTPLGNTDFVNSSHLKVGPIKNVFEHANTMRVHISGSVFVTATFFETLDLIWMYAQALQELAEHVIIPPSVKQELPEHCIKSRMQVKKKNGRTDICLFGGCLERLQNVMSHISAFAFSASHLCIQSILLIKLSQVIPDTTVVNLCNMIRDVYGTVVGRVSVVSLFKQSNQYACLPLQGFRRPQSNFGKKTGQVPGNDWPTSLEKWWDYLIWPRRFATLQPLKFP